MDKVHEGTSQEHIHMSIEIPTYEIFNKKQTLYFNYSNGKSKKMSTEDLSSYFMDKNRRGKKLDKKFILEKYTTTYNIE